MRNDPQSIKILHFQVFETQTDAITNAIDIDPITQNDNKLKKFESLSGPIMVIPGSDETDAPHPSNGHHDEHKWETFEYNDSNEFNKNNHHDDSSSLDEYDNNFPVDLSNDIGVNQMLADQGALYNPDAEIFNVHEYDAGRQRPQEEPNTDGQSFEYMPFHYASQNQFNRRTTNQIERLSSSANK